MTVFTVDDLARDLKVRNEDLLRELVTMGYEVEGPESSLETDDPAALRAQLVTILPQREVVEKRIKPTVIRRRAKPTPFSEREMQSHQEYVIPVDLDTVQEPESEGYPETPEPSSSPREPLRKPLKKMRKPEPARIIEMAPRPEPPKPVEPEIPQQMPPKLEVVPSPELDRPIIAQSEAEPQAEEAKGSPPPSAQAEPILKPGPAREPADAQAPAQAAPGAPGTAATEPAGEEKRGFDDRHPRKKKKKEKRMQPAQIIGKVELKKEPPREPERVERVVEQPPAPKPAYVPPPVAPRKPEQPQLTQFVPETLSEEAKRKKKKKDRETREVPDERFDESKIRRRKEVVLKNDLYDEKVRSGRLRGKGRKAKPRKTEITVPKAIKRRIKIPAAVTVSNLAHKMSIKAADVIRHLLTLGVHASINENVDYDTATIVASEFGFEVESAEQSEQDLLPAVRLDRAEEMVSRPPVITVMGHVDHGKTSLLDAIRETHVIDSEAGGITQHIGAYKVKVPKGELVFLDTPGHEAFTAMRARGAQVTDFVVLVVAADDGVKDQTIEAINHARAANVPIIVAVNKIDKPEADPDKVIRELSQHELIPETWGGETLFAYVSAKFHQGIDEFLDLILLQAEMMELKARPDKRGIGAIIEARLDKGKGPLATVLVKEGTLRLGDAFVAGFHYGKVRAMLDHEGKPVEVAGPATPVEVQGFSGVPEAGDVFLVVDEERIARQIGEHRQQKMREHEAAIVSPASVDELLARMQEQPVKEVNIIVKGDVQGSVEALKEALSGIPSQEVKVRIIHSGVGAVTESDVMLASASKALIIGFNVRPTPKAAQVAEQEKVDIRVYSIIYEAIENVRKAMEGLLAPIEKESIVGRAEVRQTFSVPKIGMVAGCHVVSGKIERSNQVRLLRDNVMVYQGKIISMKRFKDDIKEASEGYECGIVLENYRDVKVGDVIEAFTIEQETAKLTP
jgi:translation initiation factor IF-2